MQSEMSRVLQFRAREEWTPEEVREELNQILNSQLFAKSVRLSRFLRTSVEYLLEGKAELFKEYTVGVEVYERHPSYDPTLDSIVRTEARRLRAKLKEYYSHAASGTSIMILLVAGSYIPTIKVRDSVQIEGKARHVNPLLPWADNDVLHLAILPFRARSMDLLAEHLACDLEDELTHQLSQRPGIRVFRTSSINCSDALDQIRTWNSSEVQLVIHGCVRQSHGDVSVDIQLSNLSGMILWSKRFDRQALSGCDNDLRTAVLTAILGSVAPGGETVCDSAAFNL